MAVGDLGEGGGHAVEVAPDEHSTRAAAAASVAPSHHRSNSRPAKAASPAATRPAASSRRQLTRA